MEEPTTAEQIMLQASTWLQVHDPRSSCRHVEILRLGLPWLTTHMPYAYICPGTYLVVFCRFFPRVVAESWNNVLVWVEGRLWEGSEKVPEVSGTTLWACRRDILGAHFGKWFNTMNIQSVAELSTQALKAVSPLLMTEWDTSPPNFLGISLDFGRPRKTLASWLNRFLSVSELRTACSSTSFTGEKRRAVA